MDSNQARNELKVMVVTDLAAICKKLAESPVVPDNLRAAASEFVEEFNSLLSARAEELRLSTRRARPC